MIFGPLASPTTLAVTLAPASWAGVASTVSPSTTSTGVRVDLVPGVAEPLDVEALALFDLVLLATGLDHCVHRAATPTGRGAAGDTSTGRTGHVRLRSQREQVLVDDDAAALAVAGSGRRSDSSRPSPMRLRVISTRPELGDVEHLGAGLVPGQGVAEDLDDLVAVAP